MTPTSSFWDSLVIQSYQVLLKRNPNNPMIHKNLGLAYLRTHQLRKAIRSFRKAIKCDNQYAEAHYHLGNVYQETGAITAAIRCFVRYNEIVSNEKHGNVVVNELLKKLKEMKPIETIT